MNLIGENIHIISPSVKEAIINKDDDFILNLVEKQINNGTKVIDLNIGPAKNKLQGSMSYLAETIQEKFDVDFSLDTTSFQELKEGFKIVKKPQSTFLNSASADEERLENTTDIASEYGSNLIALTMSSKSGIPKTSDERLELAFSLIEKANEKGIDNSKIYLDPLILPVAVAQKQAVVALETIRMFKESFDPAVNTVIGLSNISNGISKEIRPLVNKTFFVLALGYGLDTAIVDGTNSCLYDIYEKIKINQTIDKDDICYKLYEMAQQFGDLEDISYNKDNREERNVIRTAEILLGKEIYSPSYLES